MLSSEQTAFKAMSMDDILEVGCRKNLAMGSLQVGEIKTKSVKVEIRKMQCFRSQKECSEKSRQQCPYIHWSSCLF